MVNNSIFTKCYDLQSPFTYFFLFNLHKFIKWFVIKSLLKISYKSYPWSHNRQVVKPEIYARLTG